MSPVLRSLSLLLAISLLFSANLHVSAQAVCGDGECAATEDATSCPRDCDRPIIDSINPTTADTDGGDTLTVTGSNFGVSTDTTVFINNVECTGVSVNGAGTSLTCTVPEGTGRNLPVVVFNAQMHGGNTDLSRGTNPLYPFSSYNTLFSYNPPTVTNVTPDTGTFLGGTSITLTGTNFGPAGNSDVVVGIGPSAANLARVANTATLAEWVYTPQRCINVVVNSHTELTCTTTRSCNGCKSPNSVDVIVGPSDSQRNFNNQNTLFEWAGQDSANTDSQVAIAVTFIVLILTSIAAGLVVYYYRVEKHRTKPIEHHDKIVIDTHATEAPKTQV